jgi:hypothetical protein
MAPKDEFDPLLEVRRHVASRWSKRSETWVDDIAAESVLLALAENPTLEGPALVESARAMTERAAKKSANDARRGHAVSRTVPSDAQGRPPIEVRRRPRSPRPPRTPKGLVQFKFQRAVADYVSYGPLALAKDATRLMAIRLIGDLLLPVARGEPADPKHLRAMEKMYRAVFVLPPELAWAEVLVEEIGKARREQLKWEVATASPPKEPGPVSEVKGTTVEKPPRPVTIPITCTLLRKWGDRELYVLTGVREDGSPLNELVMGERSDASPLVPYDNVARAKQVLEQTSDKIGRWPAARELPAYVVDHELVAWLVERMGFGGGGGGGIGGKIKTESMIALVADPAALAVAILAHADRIAERVDDATAEKTELHFREMAARVRTSAGL